MRGRRRELGLGVATLVPSTKAREPTLANCMLAGAGADPLADKRTVSTRVDTSALRRAHRSTLLQLLRPLPASELSSPRFWENLQRVPRHAIPAIERDFVACLRREFRVHISRVLFDTPNFFTHIDSFNQRSVLARRSHSKEGCHSMHVVGVAMLVRADARLPLLHYAYPGNRPDEPPSTASPSSLPPLPGTHRPCRARHPGLRQGQQLAHQPRTGGSQSVPLHRLLGTDPASGPAGGARRGTVSPAAQGLPGVRVYRTCKTVFGVERTVLVSFNAELTHWTDHSHPRAVLLDGAGPVRSAPAGAEPPRGPGGDSRSGRGVRGTARRCRGGREDDADVDDDRAEVAQQPAAAPSIDSLTRSPGARYVIPPGSVYRLAQ